MKRSARVSIAIVVLLISLATLTGCKKDPTASYPAKQIEISVHASAGGGTDVMARTLANGLQKVFDRNVLVSNRPGATGAVSMEYVQQQPADGYVIQTFTSDPLLAIITGKTTQTLDDWVPVANMQIDPAWIVANKDGRFKTLQEVIDFAKEHPSEISAGGGYSGSSDHMLCALLERSASIKLNYVPFQSTNEAMVQLLGGHLDLVISRMSSFISHVESGAIIPLAICYKERAEAYPDVPCTRELGLDVEINVFRGIAVKKGTPEAIVETLSDAVKEIMETEEYKEYEEKSILNIVPGYLDYEDFKAMIEVEFDKMTQLVEELGIE